MMWRRSGSDAKRRGFNDTISVRGNVQKDEARVEDYRDNPCCPTYHDVGCR